MEFIVIALIIISVVSILSIGVVLDLFKARKSGYLRKEADRFLSGKCEIQDLDSMESSRVFTRGLSLLKDKSDSKYKFIPQSKLCDIGLS